MATVDKERLLDMLLELANKYQLQLLKETNYKKEAVGFYSFKFMYFDQVVSGYTFNLNEITKDYRELYKMLDNHIYEQMEKLGLIENWYEEDVKMRKNSDCEKCVHNKVCGFKEAYEKTCAEIYTGNPNVTVTVKCDYFEVSYCRPKRDTLGYRDYKEGK